VTGQQRPGISWDKLSAAASGRGTHELAADPAPASATQGSVRYRADVEDRPPPLADAAVGGRFRIDRVSDEDSAALRYLASLGVRPGVMLRVLEREPFGGPLWI